MSNKNQRWQYYDLLKVVPAIVVVIVIFYFSSLNNPYPTKPSNNRLLILNPMLHIFEFGTLTFLVFFGLYPKVKIRFLIAFSILYAFFDEIHQIFVPYRYFDIFDLNFDTVGIILGYLAYMIFDLIKERFRNNNGIPDET
ncbi:MAG: VanZ family protein [Promethearchaeota archaeon]